MRTYRFIFLIVFLGLFSGCVRGKGNQSTASVLSLPQIVLQQEDTYTILSCLHEAQTLTRIEFRNMWTQASKQTEDGRYSDPLKIVCLGLHDYSSFKQFKIGIDVLESYVKENESESKGLKGLLHIMQKIEKETVAKWTLHNKNSDEKGVIEAENKELLDRNAILEKNAEQNQARIKELQKQIDQLKNIENIIKNRER